jgi:hypothetical protein
MQQRDAPDAARIDARVKDFSFISLFGVVPKIETRD